MSGLYKFRRARLNSNADVPIMKKDTVEVKMA
jgi:hypothetical protein